jgi:outer membrane protein TolC
MRIKLIIIFLIFSIVLHGLYAEQYTLAMLLNSLESNVHFAKAQAQSEIGLYNYKTARASLYPLISGSIPFSLTGINEENYSYGIDNQESQAMAVTPGLSVSQLLPTAGLLTARIADTISMSRILENSPLELSEDPAWLNSVDVSVNLAQPVFFMGAFNAAKDIINKTYENSTLNVLGRTNAIVLSAAESYFNLKQAKFNMELVKIRFLNYEENYKRINQEFEMGLWTKSDLFQARSLLIKSETDLLEAEQIATIARQSLVANYSLPDNFNISSSINQIELIPDNFTGLIQKVLENNPEAKQAKNFLNMQNASLTILRKDRGPELSLGGTYSYLTDFENLESRKQALTLSLGLKGNIFDGGALDGEKMAGQAKLNELESDLTIILINLETQTRNILDSITRLLKLMELYNYQEEAAQYEYEKGLKDLELGQITDQDVSELLINLENTRLSKQQNIINTNMTYLQLANLQGVDLLNHPVLRNVE